MFPNSISAEEVNNLPRKSFQGKIVLITEEADVAEAVEEIRNHQNVGFDTESRPTFRKGQFNHVALLQFAIPNKVFLFRINLTTLTPELISLLQDGSIKKLGIGLHDDLVALKKQKHFKPAGFVELHTFISPLGVINTGLRKLTAMILGFRISKGQQTSNWENERLSKAQQIYAATDAWVCLQMYDKLKDLDVVRE